MSVKQLQDPDISMVCEKAGSSTVFDFETFGCKKFNKCNLERFDNRRFNVYKQLEYLIRMVSEKARSSAVFEFDKLQEGYNFRFKSFEQFRFIKFGFKRLRSLAQINWS